MRALDGVPVPMPVIEQHIEATLDKLGDASLAALQKHLESSNDAAANPGEAMMDSAKN
jgi:hypothetical protein